MATKNDKVILELKKKIEEKKKQLKAADRFTPVTNCSLNLNGTRQNLNVAGKEILVNLLVNLNALKMSAESLNLLDQFKIDGFTVKDWMQDVQTKLTMVDRKLEEQRLKALETKLHNLLSVDKKVELEIEDLRNLI